MANRKGGLGKGLDALFDEPEIAEVVQKEDGSEAGVSEIELNQIEANPYQPRKTFDQEALNELAESIKQDGIVQPIIVREHAGTYQIVSGERRYRASKIANLETVPAIVRNLSDNSMAEIAIIENLQREDLNAIEEAQGISSYMTQLNLTQEMAAEKLGKSRSAIANLLRLLTLPESVTRLIVESKISMGHARALLSLDSQKDMGDLANRIVDQELSVRQVEAIVKNKNQPKVEKPIKKTNEPSIFAQEIINQLEEKFATKVNLGKKKIEIDFANDDDLSRILDILGIDIN
ncbi:MAG: ParB/RepB/Spo0J family partition protein [Lactobacillaceae bacterium]|jgi:ParB family chromosome partitioning protein|nr:ParB/RepB/Spo0J family partition protein [Lactobacillaceae bacterium]